MEIRLVSSNIQGKQTNKQNKKQNRNYLYEKNIAYKGRLNE